MFLAVSINLTRVLSMTGLPGRAAESLMQLFGVVVISTTALIPRQPALALGIEILAVGAALWASQTLLQIRYLQRQTGHPRLLAHHQDSANAVRDRPVLRRRNSAHLRLAGGDVLVGAGLYFSLIAGVMSAWVLLVEILR